MHQDFRPQYQSCTQQLPQSNIYDGDGSNATNWSNQAPTSYCQSSFLQTSNDMILFSNNVDKTREWKFSDGGVAPLYDFIRIRSKRNKGWCRTLAGISTSRRENLQTLQYYNLLLKCAATPLIKKKDVVEHFYHAFDMSEHSLHRVKTKANAAAKRRIDNTLESPQSRFCNEKNT